MRSHESVDQWYQLLADSLQIEETQDGRPICRVSVHDATSAALDKAWKSNYNT